MGIPKCGGCQKLRNDHRRKKKSQKTKPKKTMKTYQCYFFLFFYSRVEAWVQWFPPHTGSTELVNHFWVSPANNKVYLVDIIPVCQKANILYEHMYDLLSYEHMYGFLVIWTHASIIYEHMYDLLSISVVVCLRLTLSKFGVVCDIISKVKSVIVLNIITCL